MKDKLLWLILPLPFLSKFGTKCQKCRCTWDSHGEGTTTMSPSDPQTTPTIQIIYLVFQATQIQWPQSCICLTGQMYVSPNEQWTNLALWVCCENTGSTTTPPANSFYTTALQPDFHRGTWASACRSRVLYLRHTLLRHTPPVARPTVSEVTLQFVQQTAHCCHYLSPLRAVRQFGKWLYC